jgi:nucleoside-diphosphate kinase
MMQRTCVLVKPDGLQRGLVGEIVSRFEKKGLKLVGLKMFSLNDEILDEWYVHLKEKSFFGEIKEFMMWTPIVAMVWEGQEAVAAVRKVVGITKAYEAEAGSIRGDLGMSGQNNIIHASDTVENAAKEIGLVFSDNELFEYTGAAECLIYGKREVA